MRYGVCIGAESQKIAAAKACGYDYVESAFELLAAAPAEKLSEFAAELKRQNIPCESVNGFLPGSLKLVGSEVDPGGLSV